MTETACSTSKHAPGEDQYGYEDAGERWLPVHTVESIVGCFDFRLLYPGRAD
jgi:hypothetical protein